MEKRFLCKRSPIVRRIFLTMLAPTILMNLTTALASFADTVIIGRFLDDLALSVVTYATPIYMVINTFAALFAVGGSIAVGIESGKGNKAHANKAFSLSVELLMVVGLLLSVAGLLLTDQIPGWLGADREECGQAVVDMVRSYATVITVSAPIFMLNIGLAFFVRNDGRPTLSMVGMFLSIFVNIVFDCIFIACFDLGVAGAAYATVLGQLVSALVIGSHFLSKKNTLRFSFTFGKDIPRIVKNGGSTALHFVYQFVSILIINHLVTKLSGANGVVVYTVVFNLYTVALALFEGISQTIQPMVSLFYGEQNYGKIRQTLHLALVAIAIICGTVTVSLELFPQIVPMIFGVEDGALVKSASAAVQIFSTSMVIMTVNVVMGYYLQSTEHSFFAAVLVSLRCFVLFLASVFFLGKRFGLNGIWASYTVAEVLSFLLMVLMALLERRRMEKTFGETNLLLLPKTVEMSTVTYTLSGDDRDFVEAVTQKLQDHAFSDGIVQTVEAYLRALLEEKGSKQRKMLEVDIIAAEHKVILRDNFDHAKPITLPPELQADQAPALGFQRLCLK